MAVIDRIEFNARWRFKISWECTDKSVDEMFVF
jgi:hypothetical protein